MQTNDFSNLPTSWQIKTLGEIFLIERGGSPRPIKNFLTNDENGINWIKIGDTKNVSKYIYSTAEKIKPEGKKHSRFVEIGDLILSNSMSFGHPYIMKTTGCIHDGWVVFRNTKKLIDEEYAYYALISNQIYAEFSKLATGSTVKNLSIDRIKQVAIPLPPLEIQKHIVARLESAFEKIEKGSAHLQDAKAKLAKYKQSLLKSAFDGTLFCHTEGEARSISNQESRDILLTLNMTNSPSLRANEVSVAIHESKVDCHDLTSSNLAITDKENPKLPQGWTIKTLGEVFKVVGGGTPSTAKTEFWNGNIAWITSADIDLQSFIITPKRFITNEAIQSSTTNCVEKDTIIVVTRVGLGKVGITDRQTCFSQDSQALIPLENVNVKFMAFQIKNQAKNFISVSRGTTINGITKNTLKELKLVVPPLETQKQIVKLLETHLQHADKTGEFIESALNKAKQLKQSLLKSAFLGKLT